MIFNYPFKNLKKEILALGAESAGNFSVLSNEKIYFSDDFGDLLEEKNFLKFKKAIFRFLKEKKIQPKIILSDLHPLYKTTLFGQKLVKKFRAQYFQVQHHLAHTFSLLGEKLIENWNLKIENFIGIVCDGTGYGLNNKIWGGEIFNFQFSNSNLRIKRIGHLENQILIGGDLAIKEPARILISILSKFLNKKEVYKFVKKYYNYNQFELLYNQLQQNFNCQETSSSGRILDAVSILLGFSNNQRKYKHEAIDLLEKNSTIPYQIKSKIIYDKKEKKYILLTIPLFEYLIKNLYRNKKRLAATAQIYLAQGLYKITTYQSTTKKSQFFFTGGIANNKIISQYLESKGAYLAKKIPRGDASISLGQLIYFLKISVNKSWESIFLWAFL